MNLQERVPTGFVRICDGDVPLCDMPIPEAERLLHREDIYWDDDAGYQLTDCGRAYLRARFLN